MTLNSSLLLWLGTFEAEGQPLIDKKDDVYYHLADGYVCAKILHKISPEHFSSEWMKGITPVPPNGSWPLRLINLKRILTKIHDFIRYIHNIQAFEISAPTPDLTIIAQNFDAEQISQLIQLILICAINCNNKQHYIQIICSLPTRVKQDIKEAIERVLKVNELTSNDNLQDNSTNQNIKTTESANLFQSSPARRSSTRSWKDTSQISSDISRGNDSNVQSANLDLSSENIEDMRQAHHDLKLKLKQLQLEKDQLISENEVLRLENSSKISSTSKRGVESKNIRVKQAQTSDEIVCDSDPSDSLQMVITNENKKLTIELQKVKEELFRIELERDDFKQRANQLMKDLDKVITERDEYRDRANQAKRLQDELDEHEDYSDKVAKLEKWNTDLLKKNGELKKKCNDIEENNKNHIKKIVRLEKETSESIREIRSLKESLREAQLKSSQETHRADTAESNLARLTDEYNAIRSDNEKLYRTVQLVKGTSRREVLEPELSTIEENAQPPNKDLYLGNLNQLEDQDAALQSITVTSVIEMKERIVRLEYENELLQEKLNSKGEIDDQAAFGGYVEQVNSKCVKLENDNRQLKKKIYLLENHIKDRLLGANLTNPSTSGTSSQPVDVGSENASALMSRVEELQKLLFQKEHELMDLENKYKRNLQKAKDVIKALNNNQQPLTNTGSLHHPSCMPSTSPLNYSSLDENILLKKQLREREDRLLELEREFHEYRRVKEIHERLIVSAFYGLKTPTEHWSNSDKRLEQTTLTSPPHTASSSMNHSKHST